MPLRPAPALSSLSEARAVDDSESETRVAAPPDAADGGPSRDDTCDCTSVAGPLGIPLSRGRKRPLGARGRRMAWAWRDGWRKRYGFRGRLRFGPAATAVLSLCVEVASAFAARMADDSAQGVASVEWLMRRISRRRCSRRFTMRWYCLALAYRPSEARHGGGGNQMRSAANGDRLLAAEDGRAAFRPAMRRCNSDSGGSRPCAWGHDSGVAVSDRGGGIVKLPQLCERRVSGDASGDDIRSGAACNGSGCGCTGTRHSLAALHHGRGTAKGEPQLL